MHFAPTTITPEELAFRDDVRAWLATNVGPDSPSMLGMAGPEGHVPAFSRALGEQGWLGLTIPAGLGGRARARSFVCF